MNNAVRHNIIVLLMLIGAIIVISMALPRQGDIQLNYSEGKPWLNPMLTAPFDIPIEHGQAAAQRITDSVKTHFVKIYRKDATQSNQHVRQLVQALNARHDLPLRVRQNMINTLTRLYENGIVDNNTADEIEAGKAEHIRILGSDNVAQVVPTDEMHSVKQAYEILDSILTGGVPLSGPPSISLNDYLAPNLILDTQETDKLLNDALNTALAPTGIVQTGEAIIFTGNIVTPQKYAIIQTYERMMKEKNSRVKGRDYGLIGQIAIVTILMIAFYVFMRLMRKRVFVNLRRMTFLITFVALFTAAVLLISSLRINYIYIIPFALVPIIITTFFDARTSFFIHMVVVLICSLVAREQAEFIIMQFLAGDIAIVSIQELTRRSQLVRCAALIFFVYCLSFVALTLVREGTFDSVGWHYFLYFAINCAVLSFAYVLIFIVEKIFGFTSTVTLVELSDINNPVLRALSENCPGTFQHVLQVANIASEAAVKVGANTQLVRAGALYHDIGKIDNPAFFTENQGGVNPHDSLAPEQSARIVIQHVTDGLRRAEKARLPQVIRDIIAQHHGKGITRFFYAQACKAHPDEVIDKSPYSYPGPNPQTREAAILMMADACEAAVRSIPDPTEKAITAMVEKVIDGQVADGLLREAPISFRDVEQVKQVFVERLKSIYHTRISYPDDIQPLMATPKTESGANAKLP